MKHRLIILCIIVGLLVVINIGLIIGIVITVGRTCTSAKERSSSTRIIGGQLQDIKKSPFFACMIVKKGDYWRISNKYEREKFKEADQYICGSTVIGIRWVITAAHCTSDFIEGVFPLNAGLIKSGTSAWNESRKTQQYMRDHRLERIVSHEKFDDSTFENDISLVRVKDHFLKDGLAKNIPLAGTNYPYKDNSGCIVYGFGLTSYNQYSNQSTHLRSVKIKISNHKNCKKNYDSITDQDVTEQVGEWNFCAGWPTGGRDACTYDSGGALAQNDVLIGIVSFGLECALSKYPGVYTKVSVYQKWIRKNVDVKNNGVTFVDSVKKKRGKKRKKKGPKSS